MDILLDTHAVLWFFKGDEKMPKIATDMINDPNNKKYVSIASVWEVAIKTSNGKLSVDGGIDGFINAIENNGFLLLEIDPHHIKAVATLPFIHRDPFDRMLVAQAIEEDLYIMTVDNNIKKYNIIVI